MTKPKRPDEHITDTKAKKYLERHIPDEWFYTVPGMDYGIDYQVEIAVNNQVTGLNFSIQLKGHNKRSKGDFAKAVIKHTTLSYYKVRLEPVMIVVYEAEADEAYWAWVDDLDVDLSKGNKEYTVNLPKTRLVKDIQWGNIVNDVQLIFSNRTFIDGFDISKIHNNVELAAWKVYYDNDFEQAVYLFRHLIRDGFGNFNIEQALCWSLYQTFRYHEALSIINELVKIKTTENLLQMKACILAEYGMNDGDKGKIIQARDLFKDSISPTAPAMIYYNYANTLGALHDHEKAIKLYRISLQKDPNAAQAWKNLGTQHGYFGDFEDELKCYDTALSINPGLQPALFSKGVALAQNFGKYKEALTYFEQVLSTKNNLTQVYINGLFWVAEAYEQVGNLKSALYWIDYGLNFSGSNPYFLNFKSNLLAKYWPDHQELKEQAENFFNYRIELSNDSRSLYHLIRLKNLDFASAYPLLQDKTPLYKNVNFQSLIDIEFDLDMALSTLLQLELYAEFKKDHPVHRYLNHLISGYFSLGIEFWDLLEVVCAYAFNKGILAYAENNSGVKLAGTIFQTLVEWVPRLVPELIAMEPERSKADIDGAMATVIDGLPTIVFREVGAQSGFLTFKMNLDAIDPAEYFTDELQSKIVYNTLVALHGYFNA
ncbi:DUF4365 domain-containing protein [Mucilaginibacter sp. AW1-7]|uniref:DUF4365 domain-containing protein n=1 Tax=Mucilaginibacter sp. AW1-7 TaxID=3349874 RepID=UPI003F73DE89